MDSSIKTKLIAGCGIILVGCLLSPGCHGKLLGIAPGPHDLNFVFLQRIPGASAVPAKTVGNQHPVHHPKAGSSVPVRFDTKAKLVGFNRAVGERLQRTETDLRPLERRAARLQRLVSNFQHKRRNVPLQRKDAKRGEAASRNLERNGLLREANRLRTDVDRKLLGFRELDRNYRNVRQLLPTPGSRGGAAATALPRAWLDRDTERQMEQNERVYKNIINLLVQLIEVPVNIIHDIIGDGGAGGEANGAGSPANGTTLYPDYGGESVTEEAAPNESGFEYDEEEHTFPDVVINAVDGEAEGLANVVQGAEWLQFLR
uniref:Uncharacterized protein n=1 Tax=Anopheles triannulatus TaxID=58253 RepID=A0A2M4ALV3_9DIPT